MSDAGATATGLKELREAIDRLPDDVTKALRLVALVSANRIQARAKSILRSKLKTSAHALVDGIVVIPEPEKKQYKVDSTRPPSQPTNLPLWIERGTIKMAARPYMRPAGDAEEETYQRDSLKAAASVVDRLEKL